jgi:hypothetical protein
MLDAVQSAVEHLRRRPNARRVLLLISESRDRGSEAALDVVITAAQSQGVTVYAATYSAFKAAFTSKAPVSQPRRPLSQRHQTTRPEMLTVIRLGCTILGLRFPLRSSRWMCWEELANWRVSARRTQRRRLRKVQEVRHSPSRGRRLLRRR